MSLKTTQQSAAWLLGISLAAFLLVVLAFGGSLFAALIQHRFALLP